MTTSAQVTENLQSAVTAHQNGDLAKAEKLYKKVLKKAPDQPDALNLLGVLTAGKGDVEKAIALFDRAINAAPQLATVPFNKGNALRDVERLDEARAAYEAALACEPAFHDARLNLGALLQQNGDTEEALTHFTSLIKLAPAGHPHIQRAHYNIGKCHQDQGRLEEAETALLTALKLNPNDPDAHFAIANVYADMRRHQDAIDHIQNAIKINPKWSEAYSVLSLILSRVTQHAQAIAAGEKAVELDQSNGSTHLNLALVYNAAGNTTAARSALEVAMATPEANAEAMLTLATMAKQDLDPWGALDLLEAALGTSTSAITLNNIGAMFRDLDLNMMALTFYEAAHKEEPRHSEAARSLSHLKLRLGDLSDGWNVDRVRLEDEQFQRTRQSYPPFWRGEDLSTKKLHVFLEEGVGDQILQSSLIEDVVAQAASCTIECTDRLAPILRRTFPTAHVVDEQHESAVGQSLSQSDFQCPALELGYHFRQNFDAFPAERWSFLIPDPSLVEKYRKTYTEMSTGRQIVGVTWSSQSQGYGQYKTMNLDALRPVLKSKDMFFVSLQYGNISSEVEEFNNNGDVSMYVDESVDQLNDLESFFAQVAALDLVISISNSTAHVAGAVGTPAWVMLPRGAGSLWYWFTDREDSPWYPSLRLFRQSSVPALGQPWWPEVIETVASELSDWVSGSEP